MKSIGESRISIPSLGEKIEFMLQELGRSQKWLALELGVTGGRVSQLKTECAVAQTQYKKFCDTLCVPRADLELEDFDEFKQRYREGLALRGGSKWKALVKENAKGGLDVVARTRAPSLSLKGLSSIAKPLSQASLRQTVVRLGEEIEFFIPHHKIPLKDHHPLQTYVLLLEDVQGLAYLAPGIQPSKPLATAQGYHLTTASGGGFYVSEPPGQHQIDLLLLSDVMPLAIADGFQAQRVGRAADDLAAWLASNRAVHFALHTTRFFVTPK